MLSSASAADVFSHRTGRTVVDSTGRLLTVYTIKGRVCVCVSVCVYKRREWSTRNGELHKRVTDLFNYFNIPSQTECAQSNCHFTPSTMWR